MPHPSEPAPRLEPRPVEELSPEALATLARIPGAGLKGDGFPRQVLGQLLHSPELLDSFLVWWVAGKSAMALSVREQELVILRMACLYDSDYVWRHHVKVGREFGIDDAELAALRQGRFGSFGPPEEALLALTDELVERRTIAAAGWAQHGRRLTPRQLLDLIALVSQYTLFALVNNALQVPLEPAVQAVRPGLAELAGADAWAGAGEGAGTGAG